jgi:hypothetical protein
MVQNWVRMAEWLRPGALKGTHDYVAWDQTWSNSDHKGAHKEGVTFPCNSGWHRPSFKGVRMAEWLRPGLWEVFTIMLHGIEPGQTLITKQTHRGGMVLKLHPYVTEAGIDRIWKGSGWPSG